MAYKTKAIELEATSREKPNPLADQTRVFRGISKSLSCYGGAIIKRPVNNHPAQFAHSTPGAETKTLHAERVAIEKLSNLYDSKKNRSAEGQGIAMGTFLQEQGITKIRVFTELPACAACDRWLRDVGSRIDITHYYISELAEYYEIANEARATLLSTYVKKWLT